MRQGAPPLRIGTRGSPLALVQAKDVRDRLLMRFPDLAGRGVAIEVIKTTGDQIQDRNLSEIGGKGLFTKEIEEALLDGRIDLAVHSMKDMPTVLPPGLILSAVLPREDARDVLVSSEAATLETLPHGTVVGTSSLRRRAQLLYRRSDLRIVDFRGNVDTRLEKLRSGVAAATILARAGLNRLGRSDVTGVSLAPEDFLPAVAQGIVTIESRESDDEINPLVTALGDPITQKCADAERALLLVLDGSCRTPIAGYATYETEVLWLRGSVVAPDGSQAFAGERHGAPNDAAAMGADLGRELLALGGNVLDALR